MGECKWSVVVAECQWHVVYCSQARERTVSKQMTKQTKHDQMADKIANIDLNKDPVNDHEKRLQDIKRFLLNADWLDED